MTVNVETSRVDYDGDGVETTFTYPFRVLEDDDLKVIVTSSDDVESALSLNTDYTVSGAGDATGSITLTSADLCETGETLSILRDIEKTQDTDYVDGEIFSQEDLETTLDRMAMLDQQMYEKLSRSIHFPAGTNLSGEIPASSRADKLLGFDSDGNLALRTDVGTTSTSATPVAGTIPLWQSTKFTVTDYAELRAVPTGAMADKTGVFVQFRTTNGDGGGGQLYWDSSDLSTEVALQTVSGTTYYGAYVPPDGEDGSNGAWVLQHYGAIDVRAFSAKFDGVTSVVGPIQAADNVAAVRPGVVVSLPSGQGLVDSSITKARNTSWLGVPGRTRGSGLTVDPSTFDGTSLVCGFNGTIVSVTSGTSGSYYYGGNNYVKCIHFVGNISTYANCIGFALTDIRQLNISDVTMTSFYRGLTFLRCGEIYLKRTFISGCTRGVDATLLVDSWVEECHFAGVSSAGWYSNGSIMLTFDKCRFQFGTSGAVGAQFTHGQRLRFNNPIVDQNEGHGLYFVDSEDIDISDISAFDNGTTTTNKSGVVFAAQKFAISAVNTVNGLLTSAAHTFQYGGRLELTTTGTLPTGFSTDTKYWVDDLSTTQVYLYASRADLVAGNPIIPSDVGTGTHSLTGFCDTARISGGEMIDRNLGTGNEKQNSGVRALNLGGIVRNIDVLDIDLKELPVAFEGYTNITEGFVIRNVKGFSDSVPNIGDADTTLRVGEDPENIRYDTALTANRTVTLSTVSAAVGSRFVITRTGLGAFSLGVGGLKTIPASTAAFVAVMYDGTAWKLEAYGTL